MKNQTVSPIVRGAYDLQQVRIQTGNRIVANFKAKLGQAPSQPEEEGLDIKDQKMLSRLRESYKRITDAVIKDKVGKPKPEFGAVKHKDFKGDEIISSYSEFCLVESYMEMLKSEETHFKRLEQILLDFPIYTQFLKNVKGCGPAMSGVIISEMDPHAAKYPSSFWKYAGLDVVLEDNRGRNKSKDHLVDVIYLDKDGKEQTKKSITFNPFLKSKLIGVLATSFLRAGDNKYSQIYREYKNRIENHPDHVAKTKLHRNNMALRYMIKRFLVDLYTTWRALEGLPVNPEYSLGKLGMVHDNS